MILSVNERRRWPLNHRAPAQWSHQNTVTAPPYKATITYLNSFTCGRVKRVVKPKRGFMKTCFGPWRVPLNCGLCEPERGWILPAGKPNRQGLCLSWLPAHLCCVPLHGATLLPHKRVCIQTGRVRRRVAGAPIGAGRVGVHGCGLSIRCEEIVVPCCKQGIIRSGYEHWVHLRAQFSVR